MPKCTACGADIDLSPDGMCSRCYLNGAINNAVTSLFYGHPVDTARLRDDLLALRARAEQAERMRDETERILQRTYAELGGVLAKERQLARALYWLYHCPECGEDCEGCQMRSEEDGCAAIRLLLSSDVQALLPEALRGIDGGVR